MLTQSQTISVPSVNLKQITLPNQRYYQDTQGTKFPSVTTVLKHFREDDENYRRALLNYEKMLRKLGVSPEKRLQYTSVRGTIGHYILTSQLARRSNQPLPEFEVVEADIEAYLQRSSFFNQFPWWAPINRDLNYIIEMVGKLLLENDIIPVSNGLEFMTLNLEHNYAGTCDILAYYKRRLCIIDIKTAWLKKANQPFQSDRVEKFEAQVSAYKYALIEMTNGLITPAEMYIISICPDKIFPDKRRVINPDLDYYIYKCRDRFDEFLECRDRFFEVSGF